MSKKAHRMPFGAELKSSGEVFFRLWAPGAEKVELHLEEPGRPVFLPMEMGEGGWLSLVTDRAGPGSLYRYRIDGGLSVPDPASRCQPEGVHGPSQVVDPAAWEWKDEEWHGRPWEETVLYELHVGAFSSEGSFAGVIDKLDYLADLGVTAIELMPVAAFAGRRNWGYDGVLPFAPDRTYGSSEELKILIEEAHRRKLMVFLDVVCNHFGPDGNYLHLYAPQFFTDRYQTPWGRAINFSDPHSHWVRQFFIHNVLYWLEEFFFDGLRFDAVHSIYDSSQPNILEEIGSEVRNFFPENRHIHLILENDRNEAHYLKRSKVGKAPVYEAQWNDDFHHACHVLLTSETQGYYGDYRDNPVRLLGRCLAEGFAYQGEVSEYRNQRKRGEPSRALPPTAFVSFLQNHDQIGNRAFGERLIELTSEAALRAATAILLLSPHSPLLFMGEEWGSRQPFNFFCDFGGELASKVYEGRLREFAVFPDFQGGGNKKIPDPNQDEVFAEAKLNWTERDLGGHKEWLILYRQLLGIRRREVTQYLPGFKGGCGSFELIGASGLSVRWHHESGGLLTLAANLGTESIADCERPPGRIVFEIGPEKSTLVSEEGMAPWGVLFFSSLEGEKAA